MRMRRADLFSLEDVRKKAALMCMRRTDLFSPENVRQGAAGNHLALQPGGLARPHLNQLIDGSHLWRHWREKRALKCQ